MITRILQYLTDLTTYPDRHVGSPGNKAATALFAQIMEQAGLVVTRHAFDCLEWEHGSVQLEVNGMQFDACVGPYSLPCNCTTQLVAARSIKELDALDIRGKVVLLHGELAGGQIMPKNFTFYNPDEHKHIVNTLEMQTPAAIIAATGRNPEMVGGQYPFPMFEDGDLNIPNAYMTDVEGEQLLAHRGCNVKLRIDSRRVPATAEQVVAKLSGKGAGRIIVSAHIDSHKGSPGALDNASGVAVLLCLAELLAGYNGDPTIEFVPFNGEDNYASPGELLWIAENQDKFHEIVLAINIDDLGMRGTSSHISFYECPAELEANIRNAMSRHDSIAEGPAWFQSDHAIFAMTGCPTIAITSSDISGFMAKYAHTEADTIALADSSVIAKAALFLRDVIHQVTAA